MNLGHFKYNKLKLLTEFVETIEPFETKELFRFVGMPFGYCKKIKITTLAISLDKDTILKARAKIITSVRF